jgi:hypothetical protein
MFEAVALCMSDRLTSVGKVSRRLAGLGPCADRRLQRPTQVPEAAVIESRGAAGRAWATQLDLADVRNIALDRRGDHLLAVCVYLPTARECAIDRVECEWLQDLRHAHNRGRGERN